MVEKRRIERVLYVLNTDCERQSSAKRQTVGIATFLNVFPPLRFPSLIPDTAQKQPQERTRNPHSQADAVTLAD